MWPPRGRRLSLEPSWAQRRVTALIGMPQRHPGSELKLQHPTVRAKRADLSLCISLARWSRGLYAVHPTEVLNQGGVPQAGRPTATTSIRHDQRAPLRCDYYSKLKLRPSRARGTRPSCQLRRPPIRLATPAADRRAPQRRAECRGAETADRQGAFWPMHDLLLQHQQRVASGSTTSRLTPVRSSRPRRPVAP
jgi:hypothetical protein